MSVKTRFRLAFPLVLIAAVAYFGALSLAASVPPTFSKPLPVDDRDWGHVRAFDGALMFTLAPSTDQRRRYELGFGRVMFTSAGAILADDEHMTNGRVLEGEPMRDCGYHWQGPGVNVLVAIGKCVPGWAKTPEGYPAHQWIRTECLRPKPCVVVIKYQ